MTSIVTFWGNGKAAIAANNVTIYVSLISAISGFRLIASKAFTLCNPYKWQRSPCENNIAACRVII